MSHTVLTIAVVAVLGTTPPTVEAEVTLAEQLAEVTGTPFDAIITREVADEILVPYVSRELRYWWDGCRLRPVVVEVIRYRREKVMRTHQEVLQLPPLNQHPYAGTTTGQVDLPGLPSLSADLGLIDGLVRGSLGSWMLHPSQRGDAYVRLRSREPLENTSLEITVCKAATQPRTVILDVTAAIDGRKVDAEQAARTHLETLRSLLSRP